MTFDILDHPADIGFRAYGSTLPELFGNCALALVSIILDPTAVRPLERFTITASGDDRESRLVNWLNEVLYFVDGKRVAFGGFDDVRLYDTQVEGTLWGEARDRERHPARLVVKAATYHQLALKQTPDGWVAEVYLDI